MAKEKASKKTSYGMSERQIIAAALKHGAKAAKIVAPSKITTGHWVRWKCSFGCSGYRTSLICPPYTPTPAQTREMLDQFKRGVWFECKDGEAREIAVALERELFLHGFYKAFGMGGGPCNMCKACAFEEGCRHPERARPSPEGVGIDVYATARDHGFTINVVRDHTDPQHYYGLVLID